jgi:uncharacterized protein
VAGPSTPEPAGRRLAPTPAEQRIDTLDVLRGFALLGILLINIELARGSDLYVFVAGETPERSSADGIVQFLSGWLVRSKFLSAFALLFGVGAALMVARAEGSGRSPHALLARRYGWLLVLGLAHMLLLFSGDILVATAWQGWCCCRSCPSRLARCCAGRSS